MNDKRFGRVCFVAAFLFVLAAVLAGTGAVWARGLTFPPPDHRSQTIESPLEISDAAGPAGKYYVAPGGSDENPGTFARPWRTIGKAAKTVTPGSIVYVREGIFRERVTIGVSGSATGGYITFRNYPGETAVLDAKNLTVPAEENGVFYIVNRGYIVIEGFEIRNYRTAAKDLVPVGIHVRGWSHHIRISGNRIHNIEHNGALAEGTDAHGIAVYGTSATRSINNVIIDGNELYALKLGSSEALVVNGNVNGFRIEKNRVHDCNNIGIVAIGFEGVSSQLATDQARNGVIAENVVYNINSYGNPAYGKDRSADGIYVDGGRDITIERNVVHHCNIGIELASEHRGKSTSYVTVRNNFVYLNDVVGIFMGGYDAERGNAQYCTVVNNTLFRNDRLLWGNGELGIQYNTRNNVIKNNIFHANSQNLLITNPFLQNGGNVVDYNVYYAPGGISASQWQWKKQSYTGFSAYRSATGNDAHSKFANPLLVNPALPDLHIQAASPAVDAGQNLKAAGTLDIDGESRVRRIIDAGADEAW